MNNDPAWQEFCEKIIDVKCSQCNNIFKITYNEYLEGKNKLDEYKCPDCGYINFGNDIELRRDFLYNYQETIKNKLEVIEKEHIKHNKKIDNDNFEKAIGFFDDFLDMGERFWAIQPIFYDNACLWWLWDFDKKCYVMIDETDLMNKVDIYLPKYDTVKSNIKSQILESLKRVGRKHIPKEAPPKWVQFEDKAVSLKSGNIYDVTPDYFFTNPIPWTIGETDETPNMDRIFEEWVGKDYVQTLYEIAAYCCLSDYPISRLFCFIGYGRNGKTKYLNIIENLVGENNKCSTELDDLLDSRFEKAKLYRKLICLMGETNFKLLEKTSILKKLCGGDLIGFEFKNKSPFDAKNYAKIIISTNSLPATTDKTDGFYRRWLIVDFFNKFDESKDILKDIPKIEYNNLCKKIVTILKNLVKTRKFHNEGSYEERMIRYEEKSNPLMLFVKEKCDVNINSKVPFFEFYDEYISFLSERGFRKQSKVEVGKNIRNDGFEIESRTIKGKTWKYVIGLEITQITQITVFPLSNSYRDLSENTVIPVISVILKLKDAYNNLIPIYEIREQTRKLGVDDLDSILDILKKDGKIAEFKPGNFSYLV